MGVTLKTDTGTYFIADENDPLKAREALFGASVNQPTTAGGSVPTELNTANIKNKITPDELRQNQSWIEASRIMFRAKEKKEWEGSNEKLADWGLNAMAWFNYNLTLGAVPDAVSLRNAAPEQKKAFLFMMDTFDKTAYSWEGFGRALKSMALDPSTYVGLSTFGLGTAAAKSAGFAGKETLKAALRAGMYGAVEGGIYGATQAGATELARVNAGGQEEVNWGKVGFGTLAGAAVGGVAGSLLPAGINQVTGRAKSEEARFAGRVADEGVPPTATQPEVPPQAAPEAPTAAPEPELPTVNPRDLNPQAFEQADQLDTRLSLNRQRIDETEKNLSQYNIDPATTDTITDQLFTLGKQREGFKEGSPQYTRVQQQIDDLSGSDTYKAYLANEAAKKELIDLRMGTSALDMERGRLSAKLNRIEKDAARKTEALRREARKKAIDEALDATPAGPRLVKEPEPPQPKAPKDGPANRVLPENVTLEDVIKLIKDIGGQKQTATARGIANLARIADPVTEAISRLGPDKLLQLSREMTKRSKTDPERLVLQTAAQNANTIFHEYLEANAKHLDFLNTTKADPAIIADAVARQNIMSDAEKAIRPLLNDIASRSGQALSFSRERVMKGEFKDKYIDDFFKEHPDLSRTNPEHLAQAWKDFYESRDRAFAISKTDSEIRTLKREQEELLEGVDALSPETWAMVAEKQTRIKELQLQKDTEHGIEYSSDIMSRATNAITGLVLGPSSVTISLVTNAAQALFMPLKNLAGRGLSEAAIRTMFHEYAVMWRLKYGALMRGRLGADFGHSMLLGGENKWLSQLAKDTNIVQRNESVQWVEHNIAHAFFRLLNGTDEMFHFLTYHAIAEGDTMFKAYQRAKGDTQLAKRLAIEDLKQLRKNITNTSIDGDLVSKMYRVAYEKGLRDDKASEWVANQLQKNKKYLGRATNETYKDMVSEMFFRRDFSGDNQASRLAQQYEKFVQQAPWFRMFGQLFFRTPVRVFEQGLKLTPGLNIAASAMTGGRFLNDLRGLNGEARQMIAQGEMLMSYGLGMATLIGYANGNITGSGGVGDYKVERHMGDNPNWRPYSFRIGDTFISYRNLDPFATPLKVITNFFESHQFALTTQRTVSSEPQSDIQAAGKMFLQVMNATYGAVRDANLTAGIGELDRMVRAIGDPERNETAIQRFVGSKAQLLVPSVFRRGVRYFGDEANVSNDPKGWDQTFGQIINPASDKITHQYDALGFKRKNITQGFLGFMGFDVTNTDRKGLNERDTYSLREIASMSYVSGKVFVPSPKPEGLFGLQAQGVTDLRAMPTRDGQSTIYNKAMENFHRMWPEQAYYTLKQTEGVPVSPKGRPDLSKGINYRDEIYSKQMNSVWKMAVRQALDGDQRVHDGILNTMQQKMKLITDLPVTAPIR